MNDMEVKAHVAKATENHNKGYNCAQAVSCAFCDQVSIDEETMFRITEGMGLGMGCMDGTCGAISAACVLSGLVKSTANLDKPNSKAVSYAASKECMKEFKEKNGSVTCRELKGVDTGRPLRSCGDCIEDAAAIVAKHLF